MINFKRDGKSWSFSPLPATTTTAKLFTSMSAIKKQPNDIEAIGTLLTVLPESIARSMRDHHTEDEVNAFIDTILLDFGNPASLTVLGDLYKLFMGINPAASGTNEQPPA